MRILLDGIPGGGLAGNEKLKKILAGEILAGRQGHAYILEGAAGSGRHTAALLTGAAIACTETQEGLPFPCGVCAAYKKVLSGFSPDVITVNKGTKATIGVEQIRELRGDIYISANETERKLYIIEEAELMTPAAQNAFLLSLEEPPPHVMYLLLTRDASLLLDTIRSRAPVIRMESLSPETMRDYLLKNVKAAQKLYKADPAALTQLIMSADGCLGNAIALLEPKKAAAALEKCELVCELLEALRLPSMPEAYEKIISLPQKREELTDLLRLAQRALRDVLAYKNARNCPLCFFSPDDARLSKLASKLSRQRLAALYKLFDDAIAAMKLNAGAGVLLCAMVSQKN